VLSKWHSSGINAHIGEIRGLVSALASCHMFSSSFHLVGAGLKKVTKTTKGSLQIRNDGNLPSLAKKMHFFFFKL